MYFEKFLLTLTLTLALALTTLHKKRALQADTCLKISFRNEAFSNSFYKMVEKVTSLCPLSLDTNIIKFTIAFRAKLYGECLTGVECKLNLRV